MSSRWIVPNVLPMAPRPYGDEQMSSWLHRLAAANWLSLPDLLGAIRCGKDLPELENEDYAMPDVWRAHLADLCRLPVGRITSLQNQNRFLEIDDAWYARGWLPFCVSCCQQLGGPVYARAEWRFAFQTHCFIHLEPLIDCCRKCGQCGLPISSSGSFRCTFCDDPLRPSRFIPVSPGVELIVRLQKAIRDCIHGRRVSSFWVGPTSASDFMSLISELIDALLLPWRSCPKYVLADQLTPRDFHGGYNIGGRFDEPRMTTLPWFARFKVMAALAHLLLGDRARDFFEEPVSIPDALQEFFRLVPREATSGIRRRAAFWPEPLRAMFYTPQGPRSRRKAGGGGRITQSTI